MRVWSFRSCVDRPARPELGQQRQHGQAQDGEIVALDALEQLDAGTLQLIGADTACDTGADTEQIVIEERRG